MNLLFADKFPTEQLEQLANAGHAIRFEPDLQAENLPVAIAGVDALIVRSTRVEHATIAAADELQIIIRAGAGTNTIDKKAATDHSIPVCNVPGKNAVAVAELTMGLLLAIDRNIPDNVLELRKGQWNKKQFSSARGLMGRSIGIIGAGAIGLAVAERAHAFGMKILMIEKPGRSDTLKKKMAELDVRLVCGLEALVSESDIVTIHVPAADSTRNLVDARFLSWMQDDAVLLNTSRGDVVDESALLETLNSRSIRVGLDVYDGEPAAAQSEFHSDIAKHPQVYGTHHIGASTEQAQDAVAKGVIEILEAFQNGEILNRVNP